MSTGEESHSGGSSSNGSHSGRSPGEWNTCEGSSCEGTLGDWTPDEGSLVEDSLAEGSSIEVNPAEVNPAEASLVEDGLAAGSPVEGSPVEGSPVEGSPVEGSPVEGSPVEGSPAQGSPVERSLVDGSLVEVILVEGSLGEGSLGGGSRGEWSLSEGILSGGSPGEGSLGEGSPGGGSTGDGSLGGGSTGEVSLVDGSLGNAPTSHFHFPFFGIRMALQDDGIFKQSEMSLQLYLLLGPCLREGPPQCDVQLSPLLSEDGRLVVVTLFPLNESSDYLWNNLDGEYIVNLRETSVRAIFWRVIEDGARLEAVNYAHSFFEDELKIPVNNIERDSPLVLQSLGLPIDSVSTSPSCINFVLLKGNRETARSLPALTGDSDAMVSSTFLSSNDRQLQNASTPSRRSTFDADSFLPLRILHEILDVDYVDLACMEHNLLMRLIVCLIALKRPLELSLIEHREILWNFVMDSVSVEEISIVRGVAREEEKLLIELNNLIHKLLEELYSRGYLDLYSTSPNIHQSRFRRRLRLDLMRALESIQESPWLLSLRTIFSNLFRNSIVLHQFTAPS